MISQSELIHMHYEFAMAIGNSLDLHEMLKESLKTFLRKMNCPAGGVHFFQSHQGETCRHEKIISIPQNIENNLLYQKALDLISGCTTEEKRDDFLSDLPLSLKTEDGGLHITELPGLGVVIFCHKTALDIYVLQSLQPLFSKLAIGCFACLQNDELYQHKENLQELIQEKTAELTIKNNQLVKEIETRKQSEIALRKSEEKYRELVENANSIILRWDTEGRITFFNEYAQAFFGYSESEIIGKHVVGTIVPQTESSGRDMEPLMEDICNNPHKYEYNVNENLTKDGSRVWIAWTNKVLTNEDGLFRGALSIGTDITAEKQAELDLIESEARYRVLLSNEIYAISIFEIETGKFVDANDAWLKLYGYDRTELQNLSVADVSAEVESSKQAIKHSAQAGTVFIPERLHRKKSGEQFVVEMSAAPFAWKGRRLMYALIRDISERKTAENRLKESERLLAETQELAQLGSWEFDVVSEKIKWSEQTFIIAGKEPKGDFPLQEYIETVHPDDLPLLQKTLEQSSISKKPYEIEIRHRRPDGTYNHTLTRGKPVLEGEKIVKFIGSVLDLTERKILEEKLQYARKMEGIGTLAGGIAHQFNNALSGIVGNINLLEVLFADVEDLSDYTDNMKVATQRMTKLTAQLLAYARGGKYVVKTISFNDLVEDTLALVHHSISSSVKVKPMFDEKKLYVNADSAQIQMVLSAILINASEAIEGEGQVYVSSDEIEITNSTIQEYPELQIGNYVCLTIADTGKGMEEETRTRIFEPFFTTKFEGRGLGLAAAYGIIKNHNGWISIDSASEKGTTVKVYLPRVNSIC